MKLKDMPKLSSPFFREEKEEGYIVVPRFNRDYEWILDPEKVIATEKFDGTNVSVYVEDGNIKRVLNRTNPIDIWKSQKCYVEGIKRAIDEGKFKPGRMTDGQYFGELIGEKIQSNPYGVTGHLWLPFEYIKEHYGFKFYNRDFLPENNLSKDSTDQELYDAFRDLFMNLKSLWFMKKKESKQPEGIVFHNVETGEMCKLRVDMWDFSKKGGRE